MHLNILFPVLPAAPFLPCLSSKLLVFLVLSPLLEKCSWAALSSAVNAGFFASPLGHARGCT